MSRTTKIVGFSVPPTIAQEIEQVAKEERRTKSELFRDMFRIYQRYRQQRALEEEQWVHKVIQKAKREQKQTPMTEEELLTESQRLAQYGARQAQKLGIKPKDLNRLLHEFRAKRTP